MSSGHAGVGRVPQQPVRPGDGDGY